MNNMATVTIFPYILSQETGPWVRGIYLNLIRVLFGSNDINPRIALPSPV